jgi:predicted lysophospholipase L1 biosynthesis ABC-type transport system permease subunit
VRALQANLLSDFALQMGEDAPDMFLMDIQPAQREGVTALVDRENGEDPAPKLIPVLRARIVGVRGRDVNLESVAGEACRASSRSPIAPISRRTRR